MTQQLSGGFRKGEMIVISAGRQTGKSYYQKVLLNAMYNGINLDTESIFENANKPKYKFSRSKWYEVSLMFKSYVPIQERLDWCEQNFGPQPKNPDAWTRWYTTVRNPDSGSIRFSDSKDYEWFMLRWS